MSGIQDVVFRIPDTWDPAWFEQVFIRQVLINADVRNSETTGITITTPSTEEPAVMTVDSVALDGLDDIATSTFLGRVSPGTGEVENLTTAQTTSLIDLASIADKGVVLKAAAVADANASTASVGSPDASDLTTVITLANEMKTELTQTISDLNDTVIQLNLKLGVDTAAGQMA